MLVLTRTEDEDIKIGDDIYIRVLRTGGKYVRFGIEAPREINIVRTELLNREKCDGQV